MECNPLSAFVNTHAFFHCFITDNLLWTLLFYAYTACLTNIRCRGVAYGSRQDKDASKQGCMLATRRTSFFHMGTLQSALIQLHLNTYENLFFFIRLRRTGLNRHSSCCATLQELKVTKNNCEAAFLEGRYPLLFGHSHSMLTTELNGISYPTRPNKAVPWSWSIL